MGSLEAGSETLRRVRARIDSQFVWRRSLDRPYRVWEAIVELLEGAYAFRFGERKDLKFISEAKEFAKQARKLPKARRDPEFRVMVEVLSALTVLLEDLLEKKKSTRGKG